MDGIEELLYFHYLLPVAAVAVTALIAGGIVSFKRRGRRTVAGTIFLTGAAAICLTPVSGSAREKIPSADALVELGKMKNGRFRTVDWPTDEYGIWKNAEFYHLTGISDDKLFVLTADIVLRDDRYYLFEYGTAPTEDDILLMDSEDPDDPDDLDTVCPISEETAEKLIGYLHKNGDY